MEAPEAHRQRKPDDIPCAAACYRISDRVAGGLVFPLQMGHKSFDRHHLALGVKLHAFLVQVV